MSFKNFTHISRNKRLKRAWGGFLCLFLVILPTFAQTNTPQKTIAQPPILPIPLENISKTSLENLLGWTPHSTSADCDLCQGTYHVAPLKQMTGEKGSTQIWSKDATLSPNGVSILGGQVIISQMGQELRSNLAYFYPNPNPTGGQYRLDHVDLVGQVLLRQDQQILMGNSGNFNLINQTGTVLDATYMMKINTPDPTLLAPPPNLPTLVNGKVVWPPLVGWGQADSVKQTKPDFYEMRNATYTTCRPDDPSWLIQASTIDLNKLTGRGDAWNSVFYFDNVPVFYFPYMNFPIDKRRKTGFLYPTGGYSTDNGAELDIPIYFNLLPNYDVVVTPEIMSKRGVLTNAQFRYLTGDSQGTLDLGLIPYDREFASFRASTPSEFAGSNDPTINSRLNDLEKDSNTRGMIEWKDNTTFDSNWSGTANFNWVSDDYYLNDFGSSLVQTVTNQLLQQATLNYSNEHWDFLGNVENYQTLHPVNQSTVLNSYAELPQFLLNGDYPDLPFGLDAGLTTEYVDFVRQKNPGEIDTPAEGSRFNVQPSLSLPLTWGLSGYLTPKLQLQATQYALYSAGVANQFQPVSVNNPSFTNTAPTRVLPIFDVDGGLFFDRQTHLFGKNYTETLEPRIFYLYVPYENQDAIPLFDTSLPAFDFNQLFQTNRFSGTDRQGDANQISLALTTRFLDHASGEEKGSASIGQIIYFEDRRVTLCRTPSCSDPAYIIGQTSTTSLTSPLAGQLSYNIAQHWNTTANVAWEPNGSQTETANLALSYRRDSQHVLNLGYSFLRNGDIILSAPNGVLTPTTTSGSQSNDFSQPYVSFAWPITDRISAIGYFDYDVARQYAQQYFAGLEYNSCCYAVRAVASRQFQNLDQNNAPVMNNEFYVQFLLKGLGSVGNANPQGLTGTIAGYRDPFANNFF